MEILRNSYWIERWCNECRRHSKRARQGKARAAATLLTLLGQECREVVNNLPTIDDVDKGDPASLVTILGAHFTPQRHLLFERYKFNSADQNPMESVDAYVIRLRQLATSCEFAALHDSLVRDRLVMGTRDGTTRERLLRERPVPDLARCIQVLQASELNTSFNRMEALQAVEAVSSTPAYQNVQQKCQWCGGRKHKRSECPARDAICHKCQVKGHFKAVCRGRENPPRQVTEVTSQPESYFLGEVKASKPHWSAVVEVNGIATEFKLDCGAEVTVLTEDCPALVGVTLKESHQPLVGPGRSPLKVVGQLDDSTLYFWSIIH